jgi:hypothetical protein
VNIYIYVWNRPFTRQVDDFGDHLQRTFLFFSRKMMTRTPENGDRSLRMSMFSLLWLDFLLVLWEGSLSLWYPRGEQDSTLSKNVTLGVVQYWVYNGLYTRHPLWGQVETQIECLVSPWPCRTRRYRNSRVKLEFRDLIEVRNRRKPVYLGGVHFMVEPLVIIHFHRIFHYKPSSYWGTPMT